ncbi:hypothetical protein [Luteimonas notoginsengisoli]|uniref:Uncharacterized protein n=1 Tax=Luteimonas notoginsengisoli TaxID=1578200 RepID=A0ABV7UQW8_9GAMM
MPITALDIKLRKSQRLTDNPDGGGRMVQAEIVDGEMNNLFPDIGDEERTTGRSTLRKMFVHLDTPDTDTLKDAIGVIVDPPADGNVCTSMFATGSYSDERAAARNRVESYITKGVESRYVLLGNHFIGQMAISMYCMKDAPTPDINDNLCLSTAAPGYEPAEQYMRVRSILSRTTQTFYDEQGAFERDVIVVETVTALLYDFYGQEADRRTAAKPPTRIHETNIIDAASYYSVKRLTEDAVSGALSVKVDSPYVPIVPSTLAETPVSDVLAGLGTVSYVQSGPADSLASNFTSSFSAGIGITRYLGNPFTRGSVSVTVGATTLTDDGNGSLTAAGLSPWGGTVDYGAGSVTVTHSTGAGSTSVSITATPAGPILDQGYSQRVDIVQGNQGYNYLFQLLPLPAAGTVVVDYRALGKWIRLTDNGTGQLLGKPGQGSGTVNYATGSVVITTGALPDIGSAIITSYGTGIVAQRRDTDTEIQPPYLNFLLPDEGITPGSFSITWQVSGAGVTATDDGAGVLKVGATAVGSIVYATGEVGVRPTTLPDVGTGLAIAYDWSPQVTDNFTPTPDAFGVVGFSLGTVPARAGSVNLVWQTSLAGGKLDELPVSVVLKAKDDGAGNIVITNSPQLTAPVGTINYTTGAISLKAGEHDINNVRVPVASFGNGYRLNQVTNGVRRLQFTDGTLITASYQAAAAGETSVTDEIALPPVAVDLTPGVLEAVVPGSVRFTFKGATYVDRNGSLYRDIDPVSGSGTYAGSFDYGSGQAVIAGWAPGGTNAISVGSLLTRMFDPGIAQVEFRTPGAPLKAGVFTLRATTLAGEQLTATADINGDITGDRVRGLIDWESGAAAVEFGEMVPAAGNEGEPWYDPDNVVGTDVFKPTLVFAGSVYIGAVVYRSIPLSAVVVGLDPVRLPSDGRVPAFKAGQTVLIHNTQVTSVDTPAAGQALDLGRTGISQIEVRDTVGVPIDSAWYTFDLDAGTFEFSDPLNLGAYTLPVKISDRIDDRRLVAAVQITGEIELNTGLSHAFAAGDSMISTALRLGEANGSLDLQARVQNVFDQNTWTNVWSDVRIGDQAPATFNDTDFPIEVTNADAITERWVVVFTGSTSFEVRGETVGTIAIGSTGTDCAPLNPRTELPYFTIPKEGWGLGWSVANGLRFNTIGGLAPVWMVRTTLPGTPETTTDSFRFQVIGNSAGETP